MSKNDRRRARTPEQLRTDAMALAGGQARIAAVTATQASGDDAGTSTTTGELWLYGLVGGWWSGFDAESVAEALRGMDVDQLTVRLHSPGGAAMEGVAIGNLLRNYKANVTVVVDGLAASAASVIALAGDDVIMCPGAQLMIHEVSAGVWGTADEVREVADLIDQWSDNYAGVYAARAGGTPADWRQVMKDVTWYSGEDAVEAGLATKVGNVTAAGSPSVAPDDDLDDLEDDDELAAKVTHDLALMEMAVHPAAAAAWQAHPKPPTASAGGSTPTEGGSAVAFSDEQMTNLRRTLGVAEDADEATILAALTEALDERAEEPTPQAASSTAQLPEGTVLVDAAMLAELRDGATAGRAARQELDDTARNSAIQAAIDDGRIPAGRREHWQAAWNADANGTRATLEALEPGLIPLAERGHTSDGDEQAAQLSDVALDAFASGLRINKEALRV